MKMGATLILTRQEIARLINMKKAIRVVEEAFYQYGLDRVQMPAKIYLDLKKFQGDFRAMPAYIEKFKLCTLKWVNAHPRNKKFGFPSVMAVIILSDPKNGFPLSILDGTLLTSFRTGAGAAVAAKYLARKNSSVVGLVGCGVQAHTQLLGLREVLKIKEVKVFDQQTVLARKFISQMQVKQEKMSVARDIKSCVEGCDVIVTTTPSRKPIVQWGWIKKGAHINAVGADAKGKQELDPMILKRSKVVVDDWAQASHSGEINVPVSKGFITKKNIYATLGEIVAGRKKGRASSNEVTVFDSTGLAIQDVAVAQVAYQAAVRQKIGTKIRII
ncbi:MAG: alanine dehydrogenase [Candidatus Omnitrophota bacterium]